MDIWLNSLNGYQIFYLNNPLLPQVYYNASYCKLEPTINMAEANNNAPTNAIPEDELALEGYERYVLFYPHFLFLTCPLHILCSLYIFY